MPVVHEPSLQLLQFAAHLPPLLGSALCLCALLFGELAVLGSSLCESRKAILCLRASRPATMQRTAAIALVRRPLAGRASAGLGPGQLAGPIRAEAPWNALFKVAICNAENSASYKV